MTFPDRFLALLTNPDYATSDLHQSPGLTDGALMAGLYATVSAIAVFVSSVAKGAGIGMGLIGFIGTGASLLLFWVFISFLIHFIARAMGGQGEFTDTLRFVGLATAPMILMAAGGVVLQLFASMSDPVETKDFVDVSDLGLTLAGMAWGVPGVLCYYGLKNGELLEEFKALLITLLLFLIFAAIAILNSPLAG